MQIIRAVPISVDDYVATSVHKRVEPPCKCPQCDATNALRALGYYSRNVTSTKRGVLHIFVRRFRCCECGKTVSVLPSFVQPYRLVLNVTINEFFGGTLSTNALSWLPLLKQYWNRFSGWLPRIDRIIRSVVSRRLIRTPLDGGRSWPQLWATLKKLQRCLWPDLASPCSVAIAATRRSPAGRRRTDRLHTTYVFH